MRPSAFILLAGCSSASVPEPLQLPEVSFHELLAGGPAAASTSRHALSTLGALSVVGVPAQDSTGRAALLGEASHEALGAWASCLRRGGAAAAHSSLLANGAVRRASVATGGRWDQAEDAASAFAGGCQHAERATSAMRSGVRAAARAVAAAVDSASATAQADVLPAGAALESLGGLGAGARGGLTLTKALDLGSHLEHIRLYEEQPRQAAAGRSWLRGFAGAEAVETLSLHTDAGLMLAFVPPPTQAGGDDSSLPELQLPSGEIREIALPSKGDAVIFLAGEAARLLWRQEARGADDGAAPALRPAPHGLRLRPGFGWRAWYGVMLLPPEDAPVRGDDEDAGGNLTFGKMWNAARTALTRPRRMSAEIPALGCGEGRLLSDQSATCPVGMFECWMTCMDVSAFTSCTGGMWRPSSVGNLAEYVNLTLQCVDAETSRQWPDETGQMCYTCGPACGFETVAAPSSSATAADSSAEDDVFCRTTFMGTGVTMYMDGFKFTSSSPDETCVSFLLPSLVIDKHWKLVVASLGVVLMSAMVEVSSLGRRFLPKERQGDVGIIFHIISLTLAYTAMLFVMTYSVELFISVILGLALGHKVAAVVVSRQKSSKVAEADSGAGTPCCRLSSGLDLAPADSAAGGKSANASGKSVTDADVEGSSAASDGQRDQPTSAAAAAAAVNS